MFHLSEAGRLRRALWLGAAALSLAAVALIVARELALCPQLDHGISSGTFAGPQASSGPVGYQCNAESCWELAAQSVNDRDLAGAGRFSAGEIDLTGDGRPESVHLSGDTATILEDGEEVWRSPTNWTVADVALGDPNRDGRFEVLVAFWRDDGTGTQRSQPFIVGYREGQYRTLWGGSPITEPILEMSLGDVDGDGADDLVVLEARADQGPDVAEATTVAVWRWHGWGFSNMWRSAEGSYRDLALVPGDDGAPDTIRVTALEP